MKCIRHAMRGYRNQVKKQHDNRKKCQILNRVKAYFVEIKNKMEVKITIGIKNRSVFLANFMKSTLVFFCKKRYQIKSFMK